MDEGSTSSVRRVRRTQAKNSPSAAIQQALSEFGAAVAAKLARNDGSSEDHLRAPFERLLRNTAKEFGLKIVSIGETRLPDLGIRPDYAIDVAGARVGYVELKAPGTGVPETWTPRRQNRTQFEQLSLLSNVLYTDGEQWALYRLGELEGEVVTLTSSILRTGRRLESPDGAYERIVHDFLTWKPQRPRTVRELVRAAASLCRLLRSEISTIMLDEANRTIRPARFTRLANEWRGLLFPKLADKEFADAYAQTVTFALLLARVEGIDFTDRSIGEIALLLGKKHSLMGKALTVLVNDTTERNSVVIDTMLRVFGAVQWEDFDRDTYQNLFQYFLQSYDPELRKRSGSYYTPNEVVSFMVRFVDEILRKRLGKNRGFANDDVIVVDPAMGTGSYLATIIDTVAETIQALEGPGQVAPRLRSLARRVIGFERQAAPYAVAQLRLHNLLKYGYGAEVPEEEFRFLTDALDDPNLQELNFGTVYDEITSVRNDANKVKRQIPVMVVMGNPPYAERARGQAPWIETRGADRHHRPNLDAFRAVGLGRFEYVLSNLYMYFWRWGTWKVFDAHPSDPAGVVSFITTSAYTTGPGFAGMREYLRRTADEGWIIHLSPEGHQSPVNTRIFPGTQHPVCIGVFARYGEPQENAPARVHHLTLRGTQAVKFSRLGRLSLSDVEWLDCRSGWQEPFSPPGEASWESYPSLGDLMPLALPGIKPNRTWVYSPSRQVLCQRWDRLVHSGETDKPILFKETESSNLDKTVPPLAGQERKAFPFRSETGPCPTLARVAFRSFDRQWIIPDARLLHRPSPDLWRLRGNHQVFVSELHNYPITSGPGLTFSALPPDMHHFMGHQGGRVHPLWRDSKGKHANFAPGLLHYLRTSLGIEISDNDMLAYIAGVVSHSAYTTRFAPHLHSSASRVPFTLDPQAWMSAVDVGQEVLWLHTYGERFCDPGADRPIGPPQLTPEQQPRVLVEISTRATEMPDEIKFDETTQTLKVGGGRIAPVSPAVWNYDISGMRVVDRWFRYRRKQPDVKWSSPLNDINATHWSAEMTGELLELLNVLGRCVALEPRQAVVLDRVLGGPLVTVRDLDEVGIIPIPPSARKPLRDAPSEDLLSATDPGWAPY